MLLQISRFTSLVESASRPLEGLLCVCIVAGDTYSNYRAIELCERNLGGQDRPSALKFCRWTTAQERFVTPEKPPHSGLPWLLPPPFCPAAALPVPRRCVALLEAAYANRRRTFYEHTLP